MASVDAPVYEKSPSTTIAFGATYDAIDSGAVELLTRS